MASPLAQGVFQRAIGESGAAFSNVLSMDTLEDREKRDGEWVASLGAQNLAELQAMPAGRP
jgi:para-nitrobenzyl esterase